MDENNKPKGVYDEMLSGAKRDMTPGFLGGSGGGSKPTGLKDMKDKVTRRDEAGDDLKKAEKSAVGEKKENGIGQEGGGLAGSLTSSSIGESVKGGLFSGKGRGVLKSGKGKGKGKLKKYSAGAIVVASMATLGVIMATLGAPTFMMATIDYNLQDSLGFSETVAVLEEQSEHVTVAMLRKGEVPDAYAKDLADNGIEVGQVTASGDFVRTNVYIADLDNEVIAANGEYHVGTGASGELAVMHDGEIIRADDFVMAVESDPKLYAEYSDAVDISARFYYSDDVNKVYKEMGISRGSFNNWESTGDTQSDQQQFEDILSKVLESDSNLKISACDDESECSVKTTIKTGDDASQKVGELAEEIKDTDSDTATTEAAGLLNAAVSSNEPYKAAKAFIAIMEPIQRARIGDNGPANELMNVLTTETETTYKDVNTGDEVTAKKSILSTPNFAAAVSQGGYSKEEANNFSRDRVLTATDEANDETISDTTVSTESESNSSVILGIGSLESADNEILQKASDSVKIAATDDSAETFTGMVGGNRIPEGGSFLSTAINTKTLGAMPSDASAIANYRHKTETILARQAEAERATKSPFDISSPHTFMGSILYNVMGAYIRGFSSGSNGSLMTTLNTTANMAKGAVDGLTSDTIADGNNEVYTTMSGDCYTVGVAGNVEGDLYCTSHNTMSTKYMEYDADAWLEALPDDLDSSSGDIIERDGEGISLSEFIAYGMDREATVGVKSYEICEAYRKANETLLSQIFSTVQKWFGLYESCNEDVTVGEEDEDGETSSVDGVPYDIANGQRYTITDANSYKENIEMYSGYMLYDTVYSLLSEKQSSVSVFREKYYVKHPKDDSEAGVIARRSGMSKAEAQIALNYAAELNRIANYNPADRYVFGKQMFEVPHKDILIEHSDAVQVSLYCVWCGKTEYADVRNKNFAA